MGALVKPLCSPTRAWIHADKIEAVAKKAARQTMQVYWVDTWIPGLGTSHGLAACMTPHLQSSITKVLLPISKPARALVHSLSLFLFHPLTSQHMEPQRHDAPASHSAFLS